LTTGPARVPLRRHRLPWETDHETGQPGRAAAGRRRGPAQGREQRRPRRRRRPPRRPGQLDARPVFDLLLRFAVGADGRLHGEKHYRTVTEEFATTRPAFRWRQLVALARVTASAYSMAQNDKKEGRAPGYDEACRLLKVS
jgi:hypothetical protein